MNRLWLLSIVALLLVAPSLAHFEEISDESFEKIIGETNCDKNIIVD